MLKFWGVVVLLSFAAITANAQKATDWIVTKAAWTEQDEIGFGDFVKALGQTKCNTVNDCLRSPANPYRDTDPADYRFGSDCADLPFVLRSYYAWKNQLPMSYVNQIASASGDDDSAGMFGGPVTYKQVLVPVPWWRGGGYEYETQEVPASSDTRYTAGGNVPTSRLRLAPNSSGSRVNYFSVAQSMQDNIQSGFLRIDPDYDSADYPSDLYPIDIRREAVRPGAVAYSPNGHVSIVYDVTAEGRILLLNAHPADKNRPTAGNPVSRTTFETRKEYVRSRPGQGSGLKQWRPFRLVGAKVGKDGSLSGGRFEFTRNSALPYYSVVQFYGTNNARNDFQKSNFSISGRTVSYESFIRLRLATTKLDPVEDTKRRLAEACDLFKGRVTAVQDAVTNKLSLAAHPQNLPQSIFEADGDWENYATPSRDVRLRIIFYSIKQDLTEEISGIKAGDPTIIKPAHMRADLLAAYNEVANSCAITYKKSNGQAITLSFDQLVARLLTMSFDPYHCPERRWGATAADELASCTDDKGKTAWYTAEESIRNYVQKDWKASSPISLSDLRNGSLDFGKPKAPDLDVKAFVGRIPDSL